MRDLQILFRRNRKLALRTVLLAALGLGGMLAALPRADASGALAVEVDVADVLRAPYPVSGAHFARFYPMAHP